MTTIPDHVGREAVRLLNADAYENGHWTWPLNQASPVVATVAKLLMNPPAPMTDPDEEAAKRVLVAAYPELVFVKRDGRLCRATEQMRKEREAWEAGR